MKCTDCGSERHNAGYWGCPDSGKNDEVIRKRPVEVVVNMPDLVVNKVINEIIAESLVVNADNVVVNRKGDRHRKTEARKTWQREYMRKRRKV